MAVPDAPGTPAAPQVSEVPDWLKRALHPAGIASAVAAGMVTWLPSHSIGDWVQTSLLLFLVTAGFRAVDPPLTPLWDVIAQVPRLARAGAAALLAYWLSVRQFGPEAAGNEIAHARTALLQSTVVAWVLIRPKRRDQ